MLILLPLPLFFLALMIRRAAIEYQARQKAQQRARELGVRPGSTHRGRP